MWIDAHWEAKELNEDLPEQNLSCLKLILDGFTMAIVASYLLKYLGCVGYSEG